MELEPATLENAFIWPTGSRLHGYGRVQESRRAYQVALLRTCQQLRLERGRQPFLVPVAAPLPLCGGVVGHRGRREGIDDVGGVGFGHRELVTSGQGPGDA